MKTRKHVSIDHDLITEFLALQPEGFSFSAWVSAQVKQAIWLAKDGEQEAKPDE